MPRVCIVKQAYYPQDAHVCRDAETLAAQGYQVTVICLRRKGERARETVGSVSVRRLPVEHHRSNIIRYLYEYTAFFLCAFWVLARLTFVQPFQVIEVDNMPDFLVFTTLIPRLRRTKVVLYMFEPMPELFANKFRLGPTHPAVRLLLFLERISVAYAHHVITVHEIQRRLQEAKGVSPSKLSVVLNVPDEAVFQPSFCPREIGSGDVFRVITHGSLLEKYGVQTLIKAVSLVDGGVPRLEVMVVGEGEYRPQLERLARELGLQDRVRFTGWVPFDQIPSLISWADVGVVSILPEGDLMLPNKLFEYAAQGRPAVVSDLQPARAYFNNGSVIFYSPGDAEGLAHCLLYLYQHPEGRANMARQALSLYQQYRWSNTKYAYLDVFDKLTGREAV